MPTETLDQAEIDERAENVALAVADQTGQSLRDEMFPTEVVAFARGAGYDVDKPLLDLLIAKRRIPSPVRHVFTPVHLGHLLAYCESLRLWIPGHYQHEVKRTRFEAEISSRVAAGLPAVDGLDGYPLRLLVLRLVEEADPVIRSGIGVGLLAKLDALGVSGHE